MDYRKPVLHLIILVAAHGFGLVSYCRANKNNKTGNYNSRLHPGQTSSVKRCRDFFLFCLPLSIPRPQSQEAQHVHFVDFLHAPAVYSSVHEAVFAAAKTACADHFIRTLLRGYDTVLSEETDSLSQGQRQIITIARAILADPMILILDEATSSVDTRTEREIQKAMDALMEGRTGFVIAHRLSTIRNADCILVMNKGSVIEQGTHEELIRENGFYSELYNCQFALCSAASTLPDTIGLGNLSEAFCLNLV